jgi:hypothetical protein
MNNVLNPRKKYNEENYLDIRHDMMKLSYDQIVSKSKKNILYRNIREDVLFWKEKLRMEYKITDINIDKEFDETDIEPYITYAKIITTNFNELVSGSESYIGWDNAIKIAINNKNLDYAYYALKNGYNNYDVMYDIFVNDNDPKLVFTLASYSGDIAFFDKVLHHFEQFKIQMELEPVVSMAFYNVKDNPEIIKHILKQTKHEDYRPAHWNELFDDLIELGNIKIIIYYIDMLTTINNKEQFNNIIYNILLLSAKRSDDVEHKKHNIKQMMLLLKRKINFIKYNNINMICAILKNGINDDNIIEAFIDLFPLPYSVDIHNLLSHSKNVKTLVNISLLLDVDEIDLSKLLKSKNINPELLVNLLTHYELSEKYKNKIKNMLELL